MLNSRLPYHKYLLLSYWLAFKCKMTLATLARFTIIYYIMQFYKLIFFTFQSLERDYKNEIFDYHPIAFEPTIVH